MNQVTVGLYHSIMEAEVAKGLLEANGIPCILMKGAMHAQLGDVAGASIDVSEKDAERAKELLTDQT